MKKMDVAFSAIRTVIYLYILWFTDQWQLFFSIFFLAHLLIDYFEYKGVNWRSMESIRTHITGGRM